MLLRQLTSFDSQWHSSGHRPTFRSLTMQQAEAGHAAIVTRSFACVIRKGEAVLSPSQAGPVPLATPKLMTVESARTAYQRHRLLQWQRLPRHHFGSTQSRTSSRLQRGHSTAKTPMPSSKAPTPKSSTALSPAQSKAVKLATSTLQKGCEKSCLLDETHFEETVLLPRAGSVSHLEPELMTTPLRN